MRLLTLLAMVTAVNYTASAFDFSAYRSASISEAYSRQFADANVDYTIEAGNFQYEVVATYTGNHREIRPSALDLIAKWVKSLRKGPEVAKLFEHEVEVSADGVSYWFPIQNPLVEPFAHEIQPKDKVTLFIMYVGASKSDKLFIVNEFKGIVEPPHNKAMKSEVE